MCYGILNNYYFKIITVVEIKIQLNSHSHPATFHTLRLEEIWQIIWTHFENTFKKLNGIEISPQTILIRDRFSQQLKRIERLLLGLRASNPLALTSQVLVTASSFYAWENGDWPQSGSLFQVNLLVKGKAGACTWPVWVQDQGAQLLRNK